MSPIDLPLTSAKITTTRCVIITQKNAVLICFVAEDWNHGLCCVWLKSVGCWPLKSWYSYDRKTTCFNVTTEYTRPIFLKNYMNKIRFRVLWKRVVSIGKQLRMFGSSLLTRLRLRSEAGPETWGCPEKVNNLAPRRG
jgi:glycogen debranching enzyme